MSKGFSVVILVIVGLVVADNLLGAMRNRPVPTDVKDDVRSIAKMDEKGIIKDPSGLKPTSAVGKDMQAMASEMRAVQLELVDGLAKHPLKKALDWPAICTPEGRENRLAEIEANYEVYRKGFTDAARLRTRMVNRYGARASLTANEFAAREGQVLRMRRELYDAYGKVIGLVDKDKLFERNGEILFGDRKEYEDYHKAFGAVREMEKKFDAAWAQLVHDEQDARQQALTHLARD